VANKTLGILDLSSGTTGHGAFPRFNLAFGVDPLSEQVQLASAEHAKLFECCVVAFERALRCNRSLRELRVYGGDISEEVKARLRAAADRRGRVAVGSRRVRTRHGRWVHDWSLAKKSPGIGPETPLFERSSARNDVELGLS